jgi:hypothetical protein
LARVVKPLAPELVACGGQVAVDRKGGRDYLPQAMANRLFLTLLALLTGLAAQLAPAQARVCAQQTATVAIAAPNLARPSAAPVDLARLPEAGRRHARLVAGGGISPAAPHRRAPCVHIRVDRAHE